MAFLRLTEVKENLLTTESEAMDGKSLARSQAESPQGCEHDANNNTLKSNEKENQRIREKCLRTHRCEAPLQHF